MTLMLHTQAAHLVLPPNLAHRIKVVNIFRPDIAVMVDWAYFFSSTFLNLETIHPPAFLPKILHLMF